MQNRVRLIKFIFIPYDYLIRSIVFAEIHSGNSVILVADKFGEVWALDVPLLSKKVRIVGHTASVITDMQINSDYSLLITADRDEKIRVSKFPQTVTIETYCLGHTSVVTSVSIASIGDRKMLVSVGWDHRLILWDLLSGASIAHRQLFDEKSVIDISLGLTATSAPVEEEVGVDNEEDGEEKTYDETAAGNFPIRVVSSVLGLASIIAVIFKGLSLAKIFKATAEGIEEWQSIPLSELPCDIILSQTGLLLIVLPSPHYLQALQLTETGYLVLSNAAVESFRKICSENLFPVFSQRFDSSGDGGDEELRGMRKHVLDKRFDATGDLKSNHFNSHSHSTHHRKKRRSINANLSSDVGEPEPEPESSE
jgi:hypothetical protein